MGSESKLPRNRYDVEILLPIARTWEIVTIRADDFGIGHGGDVAFLASGEKLFALASGHWRKIWRVDPPDPDSGEAALKPASPALERLIEQQRREEIRKAREEREKEDRA